MLSQTETIQYGFLRFGSLDICIYTSDEPVFDFNINNITFEILLKTVQLICTIPPNTKKTTIYAVERPKDVLLVKLSPKLRS